jgi:8-oxo-dGTP pyrophosphatase MutT (NUDIX family)
MSAIIPTVGVLIIRYGKVLLIRHSENAGHLTNMYGIPAGRIYEGESEIDAAIRELHEETGLVVDPSDLTLMAKQWSAVIRRKDGLKEFSLRVFLCSRFRGEVVASSEGIPEWVAISDFENLELLPNVKEIILEGVNTHG